MVSNEFIEGNYPGMDVEELFKIYTGSTEGFVIFTFGSREIVYGRNNGSINKLAPYRIKVESTLGAGDSFKAGAVYGLFKEMSDDGIVQFAVATAAAACSSFPLALNPPGLEKINALIEGL